MSNTDSLTHFALETEQSVLGAVFNRSAVLDEVVDLVAPEDFYRLAHQTIYRAMLDLYQRREPVDLVTVTRLLRERGRLEEAGGPAFLAGLSEAGISAHGPHYARIVQDKARLRRFVGALRVAANTACQGVEDVETYINQAEADIYRAAHMEAGKGQPVPFAQAVQEAMQQIEAQRRDNLPPGLSTGLVDLDACLGGLEPGNLYVLAARPGMGKTALALKIALNVGQFGTPGLFLSLETSRAQLARRALANLTGLDHQALRDGQLEEEAWQRLTRSVEQLRDLPLYLDDQSSMTHLEVRARARRVAARWGVRLLVVDYLQLVSAPEAKSREQEVAAISRSFKALAKELDLPVVVLSQLNRTCDSSSTARKK
jgi:replicative DNA helicase